MLHSQYTNDETCYYLQIFALLMLIDYIPHFHETSQFFCTVEGVLDKGVSGQPDYILWLDCWTMKIQDRRLRPVSGWDSPWRGRQAWRSGL